METWEVVILCLLALFIGIAILMLTDAQEKTRRKKHPVWYEYYDRALRSSCTVGSALRVQNETINAREKMIYDMLIRGECTEDEYLEALHTLSKERRDAVKQFSTERETYCIDEDLKAADSYAKEHNLKWGIIYE